MNELNELILESYSDLTQSTLETLLETRDADVSELLEAMRYSTLAGGKRIRPVLVLEFCRICGEDPDHALHLACALELLHTSSLIHDDLPAMDNDDLRRGQPSCHKKFSESTALLAGDALEAFAFEVAASADLPADRIVEAIRLLARATGPEGMLGGQLMDIQNEASGSVSEERLVATHQKKTGAFIETAAVLGCIAAGADRKYEEAARAYGRALGLAFQIQDDILDVTGNELLLGKPVGSDEAEEKTTYVTLLGLEGAKQRAEEYTKKAFEALDAFEDKDFLNDVTESLLTREH